MKLDEAAVFRWVVIVGIVAAAVIAVTLLLRPLVGAILGLVFVIAGCVRAFLWMEQKRH